MTKLTSGELENYWERYKGTRNFTIDHNNIVSDFRSSTRYMYFGSRKHGIRRISLKDPIDFLEIKLQTLTHLSVEKATRIGLYNSSAVNLTIKNCANLGLINNKLLEKLFVLEGHEVYFDGDYKNLKVFSGKTVRNLSGCPLPYGQFSYEWSFKISDLSTDDFEARDMVAYFKKDTQTMSLYSANYIDERGRLSGSTSKSTITREDFIHFINNYTNYVAERRKGTDVSTISESKCGSEKEDTSISTISNEESCGFDYWSDW